MKALKVGLAMCALFVMFSAVSMAADDNKVTVTGKVSVAKDDAGKATVTLAAGDVKYVLAGKKVKDLEGKDGKTVKVVGVVKEEGDKKTLTVESFEEVAAE